ncbi:hypothetical protein P5G51_005240 [Virgibacillus sp. 179-BFC.A HS]|uniref:Uncharacterized protein n=1 Tax=Tigheibacillus jepli TaxID=3035914 RepID=A0ABU5CEY0_9BACI|nr:hypothetical protein [Virgibacillus sp. 179-BFC.A HS]MDY0404880.1 hypothetical protein [Virgibacillus sp. 179-BFC.A HS]
MTKTKNTVVHIPNKNREEKQLAYTSLRSQIEGWKYDFKATHPLLK